MADIAHHAQCLALLIAYLQDGDAIAVLQIEVVHLPPDDPALRRDAVAIEVVSDLVFLHKVVERLAVSFSIMLPAFLDQRLAHGQQEEYAYGDDGDAYGQE